MTIDIKDFFLQSTLPQPEYMRIHRKYFSPDFIQKYQLDTLIHTDNYIYCKIQKGMYGLKQSARLGYDQLVKRLATHGYSPDPHVTNIWSHTTQGTKFCLCVDDFEVKYFKPDDAHHLLATLRKYYDITVDWEGENYCRLSINWNYEKGYVDIAMPTYVKKALKRLNHLTPNKEQHVPHKWIAPRYGQTQQFASIELDEPLLPPQDQKRVQAVTGTFLYYGRAFDSTILPAINDIASYQSKATKGTNNKIQMLLDYLSTYPKATIRYYASDMILHADSDAAYLVLPGAKSRVAGYYYLINASLDPTTPKSFLNGAIHVECKVLRHVASSAAEAETAALFYNAKLIIELQRSLVALGHNQPATPLKTDNSTALGYVKTFVNQKRSKSWDMRFH